VQSGGRQLEMAAKNGGENIIGLDMAKTVAIRGIISGGSALNRRRRLYGSA